MGTYGPKATSAPTGAIILHPGDNISALVSAAPTGTTFYFEPGVYRGVSLAPKDIRSRRLIVTGMRARGKTLLHPTQKSAQVPGHSF
jgi:hypothetical protein